MYSRKGRPGGEFRLPEHYSGVAFDRAHPVEPRPPVACAEGLPAPRPPHAPAPPPVCDEQKAAPPPTSLPGEGLLGGIGGEELLLCGIILLLAGRPGEDDTILLLLLLLLQYPGRGAA